MPTYPADLTEREVEVLQLVARGLSDAQAAEILVISPRTVNAHLRSIYSKLNITSRHAATLFALEQKCEVNPELNKFRRLVLVAARRTLVQCLKPFPCFCVVLLLKGNLRKVELRFSELRIQFGCLLKCSFGLVELLLLHQNLATQIQGQRLVRICLVRFAH